MKALHTDSVTAPKPIRSRKRLPLNKSLIRSTVSQDEKKDEETLCECASYKYFKVEHQDIMVSQKK